MLKFFWTPVKVRPVNKSNCIQPKIYIRPQLDFPKQSEKIWLFDFFVLYLYRHKKKPLVFTKGFQIDLPT